MVLPKKTITLKQTFDSFTISPACQSDPVPVFPDRHVHIRHRFLTISSSSPPTPYLKRIARTTPSHLQAVVRILGSSSATAVGAVVLIDNIAVVNAVEQGLLDVILVGWLARSLESLQDVVSVVS